MIDLLKEIIEGLKVEISWKEILSFLAIGIVVTFFIFTVPMGKTVNGELIITVLGFAVVFVLLYVGTKAYGHFLDGYYQGHIDRYNKKHKIRTNNKGKKK